MTEDKSGGEAHKDDATPIDGASRSRKEIERRAEQIFGLPLLAENGWDSELIQSMIDQYPAAVEKLDSCSFSNRWYNKAHEAIVVTEIGADISRRYANRHLRPGFDANDVALVFRKLTLDLLTNNSALEALKPENAIWRGKLNEWANRCAGHFAMVGASPFPEPVLASFGVKPFLEVKMARSLVIAWTALGGELLIDFLKEIVRRGLENRDPTGFLRRKILICQAAAGGASTAAEIRERVEPLLRVRERLEPSTPDDPSAKPIAQAKAEDERIRFAGVIQKTFERMRKNPGKVRGKAKVENFGFGFG